MISYLINSFLCSLILYLAYILLLENENIHRFKRGYLLFSLVFSLLIPLIPLNIFTRQTMETPKQTTAVFANLNEMQYAVGESIEQKASVLSDNLSNNTPINFPVIFGAVYGLVAAALLFRFLLNILSIAKQKRQGIVLANQGATIVLMKEKITPHSFGKYIFINREDYENKQIANEIIAHESLHINQRHFLDIIFVELLLIFFWFNPALYLYRNKIKLNHEFLADKAVIRKTGNIPCYQTLLIGMACRQKSSIITSRLNYLLTKKRLIMMTKTTSKKSACCRTLALIPVFLAAIAFFTTKMTANVLPEQFSALNTTADETVIIPGQGISSDGLNEYKGIVDKYLESSDSVTFKWKSMKLSDEDYNRLYILYIQMNPEQRKAQPISFSGVLTPLMLRSPNVDEWNNCKRKNTIFLDGEKVDATKVNAMSRKSIVFFTYNNEKSTSFLWTKKGYDNYIQKWGKEITQTELLKTQASTWFWTSRSVKFYNTEHVKGSQTSTKFQTKEGKERLYISNEAIAH